MKVKQMAKNQLAIIESDKVIFQSYDTIVCIVSNLKDWNEPVIKVTEGQPQSTTTAKWLNHFLKEYTSYDNYKKLPQFKN